MRKEVPRRKRRGIFFVTIQNPEEKKESTLHQISQNALLNSFQKKVYPEYS